MIVIFTDAAKADLAKIAVASIARPRVTPVSFYAIVPPRFADTPMQQPSDKITFTMPAEMAAALRASVAEGEYSSTSEALRDAVRIWQDRRVDDEARLAMIRARIRRSIDDLRPALTPEEVDANLDARASRLEAEYASANAAAKG